MSHLEGTRCSTMAGGATLSLSKNGRSSTAEPPKGRPCIDVDQHGIYGHAAIILTGCQPLANMVEAL